MKKTYAIYRDRTHLIENSLTKKEKDLLESYKTKLLTSASPTKVKQGLNFVLQFRDIIEKPLTQVKKKDLEGFWGLVKLSEHEYNTKVMIKRSVKRFCKWYYKDLEMFEGLTVGDFKPNRKKINKTVLLNCKEIEKMLRKANTLRDKSLLILMYESGARPQEIKDLKWKDINWDSKEVHLDSSKTERDRDLPIDESIVHLKRWRQEFSFDDVNDDDYIFPSRYRDKKLTTEYINKIIQTISNRAKIKKPITSYTLRHSRLSEIHSLGVKGLEHNKFSGHKEGSKQTATYVHLDNKDMKEEVLKKVYHIEELDQEKKEELLIEIDKLKKQMAQQCKLNKIEQDFRMEVMGLFDTKKSNQKILLKNLKQFDKELKPFEEEALIVGGLK